MWRFGVRCVVCLCLQQIIDYVVWLADLTQQQMEFVLPSLTMALPCYGALRPFKGAQQAPVEHHQAGGAASPSAPDVLWPTHLT
jgi:hypothetical protein